jgi:hypothetical protein
MVKKTVPTRKVKRFCRPRASPHASVASVAISSRQTRQCAKKADAATTPLPRRSSELRSSASNSVSAAVRIASPQHLTLVESLPTNVLTTDLAGLNRLDLTLLHAKQHQLRRSKFQARAPASQLEISLLGRPASRSKQSISRSVGYSWS